MAERPSGEIALLQRASEGDLEALSSLLASPGSAIAAGLRGGIDAHWQSGLEIDDVMQVTLAEAFLNFSRFDGETCRHLSAGSSGLPR